jgi:hypothetical protein
MITVAIFAVSLFLLAQFSLFYWRTLMLTGAAEELSERIQELGPAAEDLAAVTCLHRMCPGVGLAERTGMLAARSYHASMRALKALTAKAVPSVASWAQAEITVCTRYAAVRLDHRLAQNLAFSSNARTNSW